MTLEFRDSTVRDVICGERVIVVRPTHIYGAVLGDDVFVGPFCEIQQGVSIGRASRIQSHSFICELVTIREDCFIGHGVMFINDHLRVGPARGDTEKWKKTSVGNRVSIGSNATVLPVHICSDVIIGAGSVVTSDIREPGVYVGNPARWLRANS